MRLKLPKEASGQARFDFYRNVAGFTGRLRGKINFALMMHSDLKTRVHILDSANYINILR